MPPRREAAGSESEEVGLEQSAEYLLEEARMVLPGIQALFGFQLVAVFNAGFDQKLTEGDRRLHLVATALVAVAIALIMTPAAYHRQTGTRRVTADFIRLSSRLLVASLVSLAVALCLEFFLVAAIIAGRGLAIGGALGLLLVFAALWFGLPRARRRR
jgi:succinate dehydrogenase hydrophobic anchor subunit